MNIPCSCGSMVSREEEKQNIPVLVCECGIIRQKIEITIEELECWYRNTYYQDVYRHSYDHDRLVAKERLEQYRRNDVLLKSGDIVIDIGSGNGAFVDMARESDLSAYGCDIHTNHNRWTYNMKLKDIHFPSNYASLITLHDSLEHMVSPQDTLETAQRILKNEGWLIIDFPDFFSEDGKHHWKKIEHLWFFTADQLQSLLERYGFKVVKIHKPIPSKIVLYAQKISPVQSARILVPPGIGDIYWVMCKLQSFLEVNNIKLPEIWILSTQSDRNRSLDYVRKVPFVIAGGYYDCKQKDLPVWHQAYFENGPGIFRNVLGFDFFLSANGPFRFNKTLEQIMPKYQVNWYPPIFSSLEEMEYGARWQEKSGPFIVAFFVEHGTYKQWLADLPVEQIFNILQQIHRTTGHKIILTGAEWNRPSKNNIYAKLLLLDRQQSNRFLIDLSGQTTLEQFFGLLRSASGCIGFCGGNTIMSVVFKKPTMILWNNYYPESFWKNSCPPDSLGHWYLPVSTKSGGNNIANEFVNLIEKNPSVGE